MFGPRESLGQESLEFTMEYLFFKLIWYVAVAFAIGLLVGWISCGHTQDE
jgi:hypothetical protein